MSYVADAPVTILKWPVELQPSAMQLRMQALTARFQSPLTRGVQTQELPGGRFVLSFNLPPMREDKWRLARSFFAQLRGSAGRFYFRAEVTSAPIPSAGWPEPASYASLTADDTDITADTTRITADAELVPSPYPTTSSGTSTDPHLIIGSTSAPTGTVLLQAGRHISFDGPSGWRRLHVLTDDAFARADGSVYFNVEPPLREFPAAGAPLHLACPSGIFALVDDDQGQLTLQPGRYASGLTVDAFECYPGPLA